MFSFVVVIAAAGAVYGFQHAYPSGLSQPLGDPAEAPPLHAQELVKHQTVPFWVRAHEGWQGGRLP